MSSRYPVASYSRVSCYNRCAYQHYLRYEVGVRPRTTADYLRKGVLVHAGLEAAIREECSGKDDQGLTPSPYSVLRACEHGVQASYDKWAEKNQDLLANNSAFEQESLQVMLDAVSIAKRTVQHLGIDVGRWETKRDENGNPLVEYKLYAAAPTKGWQGFVAYLDWVATDKESGYTWLLDFKTRKAFQNEEHEETNLQSMLYQYLLSRELGLDLEGTCTVQIRSKPVGEPKVTQKGKLSRAANQNTDWPTYRNTVVARGENPDDYLDVAEKLPVFHQETYTYRPYDQCHRAWEETKLTLNLMSELVVWPRSLSTYNCQGCGEKEYCLADLRGDDPQDLLGTLYTIRDRKKTQK